MRVESISAVTLAVRDIGVSVDFYQNTVGLQMLYGGKNSSFTSFKIGDAFLNLVLETRIHPTWWGRLVFHVDDVDALYKRLTTAGLQPSTEPADASWGERYFHIDDPDGHELSFACPLTQVEHSD